MKRFLVIPGLLAGLWTPSHAATAAQKAGTSASLCADVRVAVAFGNSAANCSNGARVGSYAQVTGWSYYGGAAPNGIIDVDCNGLPVSWPGGTPRVMCNGISLFATAQNSFLNSAVGATQTVTTTAGSWTLSFWGTGSITGTGTCSFTLNGSGANTRVFSTTTETAGACVLTVSGSVTNVEFDPTVAVNPVAVTLGSPATRTADVATISVTMPTVGTAVGRGTLPPATLANPNATMVGMLTGSGSYFVAYGAGSYTTARTFTASGTALNVTTSAQSFGGRFNAALTWNAAGRTFAANGVAPVSDANPPSFGSASIQFGALAGVRYWNAYLTSFVLYTNQVDSAQLQSLAP